MMEQAAIDEHHGTTPLDCDPNVVVVVERGGEDDEEKQELGLGLESTTTNKTGSFSADPAVENPSGEENDLNGDEEEAVEIVNEELSNLVLNQADDDNEEEADEIVNEELSNLVINQAETDDDEFEEAERMLDEELRNLVLTQAINEQKSWFDSLENEEMSAENVEEMNGESVAEIEENGNVGNEGKLYSSKKFAYPLRLDAEDCSFFMKTGSCKYGPQCKFNHPPIPKKKNQAPKDKGKTKDEHLERTVQTECKYYLSSGGCKYGKACKYTHTRARNSTNPSVELNFLGLPIRMGEKECTYYMRNGSCKYGSSCRFNHPDPTAVSGAGNDYLSGYKNINNNNINGSYPSQHSQSQSSWSSPRALTETASSYVPMIYPPTQTVPSSSDWNGYQVSAYEKGLTVTSQGVSSSPEWNGYQASVYPISERGLPTPPAFTMAIDSNYTPRAPPQLGDEYPERPGQPECSYFMKTGDCKYKYSCKFNHPKRMIIKTSASCALSDKGLPLRPDSTVCSYYSRYGICKFGPSCKFDHPENSSVPVSPGSNYE